MRQYNWRILVLSCALLGTWATAAASAEQPLWELRPYRIQVFVGVVSRPECTTQLPTALAGRLTERIESLQGGAWNVAISPAPAKLQRAMAASLDGVTRDSLPKISLDGDKVMLLGVSATADGYRVAAREFDIATGLWSAPVSRSVRQFAKIADQSLDALFEAFAPLARVSVVKDRHVILRLRASALKPRDSQLAPVKPGDVFRLVSRSIGDESQARRVASIPWTYCTVEEVAEKELHGRLETGLRDPLAGRWETSMEVLALGVVPPRQSSVLTLKSTTEPAQPLAGYDVYVSTPGAGKPMFLGRNDRQGTLKVPAADNPLQILLVKHGGDWLARLPVVAGLEPQYTVAVAPDSQRIELEGFISTIHDAAVDLAAQREMLIGRLKDCMKARRFDEAERLLKELRQLPTVQECVKTRARELMKDIAVDPASQGKIDAALTDIQAVLAVQFDEKAVENLVEQIPKAKEKEEPKPP